MTAQDTRAARTERPAAARPARRDGPGGGEPPLPRPRGPLSETVVEALRVPPGRAAPRTRAWTGPTRSAATSSSPCTPATSCTTGGSRGSIPSGSGIPACWRSGPAWRAPSSARCATASRAATT
ncbi:hypothetical protein [Actinomadura sp. J1-007]|uniref:hypothetical protein n=1 Tax=Actinomadura sp. J1-007 TaxID=2661913 RepID=UPI0028166A00|nr:hypothetical protein [Actinomadura sp. J1-007]